jgi:hypothetical protein
MAEQQQLQFPQAAYEVLVNKVHRPVFLEKLAAEYNIIPQSPQDEFQLLELAGLLREARESQTVKTAAAGGGNNFLTEATDSLKGALSQLGYGQVPTFRDRLIKQAAAGLSQDPEVVRAVEEFGSYWGKVAEQNG